jgi:hypothetical protein
MLTWYMTQGEILALEYCGTRIHGIRVKQITQTLYIDEDEVDV